MAKAKLREVLVVDGNGDEQSKPKKVVPLFSEVGDDDEIVGVSVCRLEPIDEGSLGAPIPPDSDEENIRRRWGGGVYKLMARRADGTVARTRQVVIAGDPKFESLEARRKYAIKMGTYEEQPKKDPTPAAAAAAPTPGLGIGEILALVTQGHQQQMQMMRLQMEASQREASERETRARREAEEARQRDQREATEREDRRRREAEEARERDRQFQATMMQMLKTEQKSGGPDPMALVDTLLRGLKLGRDLGGGGGGDEAPSDPLTALFAQAPAILERVQGLAQQQGAAAAPPAPAGGAAVGGVRVTGPLADKLRNLHGALKARGVDPDQALAQLLENVQQQLPPPAPPPPASPSADDGAFTPPPPAVPDEAAQRRVGGNGTPARARATRKK